MNIHEALLVVRREVGAVGKNSYNDFHKFKFRGYEEVLNKVGPALLAAGVNCVPELRSLESRDITTEKGKRAREVTVTVAYHYTGPEGDEWVALVPGESSDTGSSAVSKAMSVALRIAHIQALQIPLAMTDPEAGSMQRADDPMRKVKDDIWAEAEKQGWIGENGEFVRLSDEFAEWSRGETALTDATQEQLAEFLVHLRPHKKMSRARGTGEA